MSNISTKIKKEFLELIPPTIFFVVALNLVAFVRSLSLHGTGVQVQSWFAMTVSALLLAKTVLILDLMPILKRYHRRPLIYNILWKTLLYLIAATVIHYGEDVYGLWDKAGSLEAANRKLLDEMLWPQFWAIHIFMAVLLLIYCTMRELGRRLGAAKMREIFLAPAPEAVA
ncbi:MAG: hypothetical protein K8R92_06415 [Planctomycetes bacterium]|nr:hypothetical protein [Planctomycetota bacterium]